MFRLHLTNVEKIIRNLKRVGRTVDTEQALRVGHGLIAENNLFPDTTTACEVFKSKIWNMGLVV